MQGTVKKTIKLYSKDSELVKKLQAEYLKETGKRIVAVKIISRLLDKASISDIL